MDKVQNGLGHKLALVPTGWPYSGYPWWENHHRGSEIQAFGAGMVADIHALFTRPASYVPSAPLGVWYGGGVQVVRPCDFYPHATGVAGESDRREGRGIQRAYMEAAQ